MWIFCCGPLRSGSTLQFNIVRELIERTERGVALAYVFPEKFPELYEKYKKTDGIKVFKTHEITPFMESIVNSEKVLCVYCYRDIRDVVVSLEHKGGRDIGDNSDFSDFTKSYLNYYNYIKNISKSYMSKYEDFYDNIQTECLEIAKFIGIEVSNEIIVEISSKLHFNSSKKYINEVEKEDFESRNGKIFKIDKKTMLHHNHFKHVYPGAYKEYLDKKTLKSIESVAFFWLKNRGYKVKFLTSLYYKFGNFKS